MELLSSALWLLAGVIYGASLLTVMAVFFFYLLLILSFIDIDLRRLPNGLVGLLLGVGAIGVLISQLSRLRVLPLLLGNQGVWTQPAAFALAGAAAASGLMLAVAFGYQRLRHTQGLGMGDVKLLAVLGLYLGLYALLALLAANILGAVWGAACARVKGVPVRDVSLPFGPFLAASSVAVVACGPAVWGWYLALFT